MEIIGKITGIKYKTFLTEDLKEVEIKQFNINEVSPFCVVKDGTNAFTVSKWVSPKRTRSYPYERVYNTLNCSKKITVIPIIKDEGADGDRDFLQWDTISLMSLLDVFVIFAYYDNAIKNPNYDNKITDFQFNNDYIVSKIQEIENYHSSALHWNLNELKTNLHALVDKAKIANEIISTKTMVKLHSSSGIDNFKTKIGKDVEQFMQFSRAKAKDAQSREIVTTQPKEALSTLTKAKITITNYLGGQYFFTVDEVEIKDDTIYLIEGKHSKNAILPSVGDIKDGLLKMILYSNLVDVEVDGVPMKSSAVLKLTSAKLKGGITNKYSHSERAEFIYQNDLKGDKQVLISYLFKEAEENGFEVRIEGVK